jgi:hypothetical protein
LPFGLRDDILAHLYLNRPLVYYNAFKININFLIKNLRNRSLQKLYKENAIYYFIISKSFCRCFFLNFQKFAFQNKTNSSFSFWNFIYHVGMHISSLFFKIFLMYQTKYDIVVLLKWLFSFITFVLFEDRWNNTVVVCKRKD